MKTVLPIIVIVAVIAVGTFIYTSAQKTQSSDSTMKKEDNMMPKDRGMQKTDDATVENEDSRYIIYSKTNLDNAKSARRVLFFYANWCPTCRPADVSFSQNKSKVPSDVTLIRVNYNDTDTDQEEKDLAAKYGVTYQHTFVQIDENDNAVTKWNGGQIDELLQKIK